MTTQAQNRHDQQDQFSPGNCGTMGCSNSIPILSIDTSKQAMDTLKGYFKQVDNNLKKSGFKINYVRDLSLSAEEHIIFRNIINSTDKVVEKCSYTINITKGQFPDLLLGQISASGCAELF